MSWNFIISLRFLTDFSTAGDDVKTERELPPLMLSNDFKCKNFNFGNHYFHLHGGESRILFHFFVLKLFILFRLSSGMTIDCETPHPERMPADIFDDYDRIKIETLAFQTKWEDKTRALQDAYPVPIREYNGVK